MEKPTDKHIYKTTDISTRIPEAYSGPCQKSKIKIVSGFEVLIIFAKSSILGVCQSSE